MTILYNTSHRYKMILWISVDSRGGQLLLLWVIISDCMIGGFLLVCYNVKQNKFVCF